MTVSFRHEPSDAYPQRVIVDLTRGDRLAFALRVRAAGGEADAARLAALTGAEWLAQVRTHRQSSSVLASFSVVETVADGVGVWVFSVDDTTGWAPGERLFFDVEVRSGPLARHTFLAGSSVNVWDDVSRPLEEESA